MFDITSSKLLLLGIVALLVIGPKDFPALLRTIGKYVGIIRGQAKEFRAQFDEAMRESELSDLKKDVENIAKETEASLHATGQTVETSLHEARQSIDTSLDPAKPAPDPLGHDAGGLPLSPPEPTAPAPAETNVLNGSHAAGDRASDAPPASTPAETTTPTPAEQARPTEKSGA
jgi:sec-independent protein translocase protein TatB